MQNSATATPVSSRYLDRRESADYLTGQGFKTTKNTLQKLATTGGGPEYQRFGHRAVYTTEGLDAWAKSRLSAPIRSTSTAS